MTHKTLTPMDEAITRMLVDRAGRRRESLAKISRATGIKLSDLGKLARMAGIRYKHRHQSPSTIAKAIALVRDQGLTVRQAAKAVGMSKTSVHRFVVKKRQKAVDAAGPVRFKQSVTSGKNRQVWTCETHGKVTVWPCVICLALAAKRK